MRPEVIELQKLGIFPSSTDATVEQVTIIEQLLHAITRPVTDDEARILIQLFHPSGDTLFGLSWTLLHLIETVPSIFQIIRENLPTDNDWVNQMKIRAINAGWIITGV